VEPVAVLVGVLEVVPLVEEQAERRLAAVVRRVGRGESDVQVEEVAPRRAVEGEQAGGGNDRRDEGGVEPVPAAAVPQHPPISSETRYLVASSRVAGAAGGGPPTRGASRGGADRLDTATASVRGAVHN